MCMPLTINIYYFILVKSNLSIIHKKISIWIKLNIKVGSIHEKCRNFFSFCSTEAGFENKGPFWPLWNLEISLLNHSANFSKKNLKSQLKHARSAGIRIPSWENYKYTWNIRPLFHRTILALLIGHFQACSAQWENPLSNCGSNFLIRKIFSICHSQCIVEKL